MGLVWLDNKIANMMGKRRKDKEIKPYFELERDPCPFRGFHIAHDMMFDSKGNQCALKTGSYSPCGMETAGNKPNWYKCSFNTEENRKKLQKDLGKVSVFPRECRPPTKIKSWKGILLKDWMIYMAKK
jgi:hypothetical protein